MTEQLSYTIENLELLEVEVATLMDRLDKGCAVIGELEQKGQTDTKKYKVNFEHWKNLLEEYEVKQTYLYHLQQLERAQRLANNNITQPKAS